MRAVVESPRMTELAGINAGRVSAFAWILSSCMAALAGVLLAPLYSQLDPQNFTVLLVWGIAGAVIGRFASLPGAALGGLALGVAQQILAGYLPAGIIATGLRPSLPFWCCWSSSRSSRERQIEDPTAGCDPPARPLWSTTPPATGRPPPWPTAAGGVHAVGLWHRALHRLGGGSPLVRSGAGRPPPWRGWSGAWRSCRPSPGCPPTGS